MSLNPNIWVKTLPNNANKNDKEKYNLDEDKWVRTIQKKKTFNKKKYFASGIILIFSIVGIISIKNETRTLQKEINNLQASINTLRMNLHEETLEHEFITSPENISILASKYLEIDLTTYSKSQFKSLNKEKQVLPTDNKITLNNNISVSEKIKFKISKKIENEKNIIKNMKVLYSDPKNLPTEIKTKLSKKIKKTKTNLKALYSDPKGTVDKEKAQKWAVIQVVKVFLGIPVIPGR